MKKVIIKRFCCFALLTIAGIVIVISVSGRITEPDSIQQKPTAVSIETARLTDLELPDVNQVLRSGDEWLGKIVIVNHWATWCPPCMDEIPILIEFQETMEQQGVQVVGIAHDQLVTTRRFGRQIDINYPSLVVSENGNRILQAHGNTRSGTLPFTAIFDRDGHIVKTKLGKFLKGELEVLVEPMLSK